ncbi:MSC_0623 family F1-like ATPase-associated protein [Mycoplasmopsis pulmonis]|uniref:MSC_0623 family F1-like ATPase-associated protein n=1 Tax=Mycoplasmopsis pulmonis TaxID=2107 RepID=UPI002ACD2797|nr:DUF2714 domain-containing protein [Mycoplasmopsis pulmonis]MDZ7293544.1 DUF2714 domain-containing protein [Mycoplasmopsis pulmonis]
MFKFWNNKKLKLKKEIKLHENVINHYREIMSNPSTYLVDIENFKYSTYLYSNFSFENDIFEKFLEMLSSSIKQKKQIVFSSFTISWEKSANAVDYPVIIQNKNKVNSSLLSVDFSKDEDEDIAKLFRSLNKLIDYYFQKDKLVLRLPYEIIVFGRQRNDFSLLFSERVLNENI